VGTVDRPYYRGVGEGRLKYLPIVGKRAKEIKWMC